MTVPIYDLLTQYTGTGSRTFFEYGFEVFDDTGVFVLVNGVPVTVVMQATGIIIDPAPAVNDTILIYRETDVTQLRDFQPFESFKADKTESAVDKLIYLKQEADLWRALMNLHALPYVDRVEVINDKGTDAIIFLWDTDQAGMFAGKLGTLPNVGAVVDKPEDFAYFECGAGGGEPPAFLDYEFILLMTTQQYMARLVGIDYTTGDWTDFGSLYCGSEVSIATDGEFLFRSDGAPANDFYQYVWRGTCFSQVAFQDDSGNTLQSLDIFDEMPDQMLVTGMGAGADGIRVKAYTREDPFAITTAYNLDVSNTHAYKGLFDLRYSEPNLPGLGDAFVAIPGSTLELLATYQIIGGVPTMVDAITGVSSQGDSNGWAWDRDSGYLTATFVGVAGFTLHQVDMSDLSISTIGFCATLNNLNAAAPTPNGLFITLEDAAGPAGVDLIRTYSRAGTSLTLLDEVVTASTGNPNCHFRTSPYSRRIWLLSDSSTIGGSAYEVDDSGTITELVNTNYGFGTSGYGGSFIAFLAEDMVITTNGFVGIKAKLYEAWEMDETGSVTRVGAMGNADFSTIVGTVTNRTGVINNAADFDGASALQLVCTDELNTVSTFSVVVDVCIDTKAADQWFFVRGRSDWISANPEQEDFGLYYVSATDRFAFYVRVDTTFYSVDIEDLGSLTLGQFYNVYCEYNKLENKIKIRGDGGALYETSLPVHSGINHYNFARLTLGRRTSAGTATRLDGGIDQMFWFWDALTGAQQDFMYNSGSSRAFSEL